MSRTLRLVLLALALSPAVMRAQLAIPEIPYDAVDPIKLPDNLYLGEAVGVATNSKGNIFVYTRTGNPAATLGTRRTFARNAARLFEFDPTGKLIREIGQDNYGFVFAHTVRVDKQDNIWVVDEGSNMIIKFDPSGRIAMTMGRKPEALDTTASVAPPPPAAPAGARASGPGAPAGPPAPVGAGLAGQEIAGEPSDQHVVARAAGQRVELRVAGERVGEGRSDKNVDGPQRILPRADGVLRIDFAEPTEGLERITSYDFFVHTTDALTTEDRRGQHIAANFPDG